MEGVVSAEDNDAVKEAVLSQLMWMVQKNTVARPVKFCAKVWVGGIAKNADGKNQTSDGGC